MLRLKVMVFFIDIIVSHNYFKKIRKGIDLLKNTWYINNRRCETFLKSFADDGSKVF